jgi:hypothetical protein
MVWSQGLVAAPAGVNVDVTPIAQGNINFSQMKLSPAIIVYFSVDTVGEPGSFHASNVESNLQSQLSANVFDSPPAGHSVLVKVKDEATPLGKQGWNGNPKSSFFNRVDWITLSGIPSYRSGKGLIQISDEKIEEFAAPYSQNVGVQTFVNTLAHEGIWGNAGGNHDCFFIPFIHSCTDGDISGGSIFSSALAAHFFFPLILSQRIHGQP